MVPQEKHFAALAPIMSLTSILVDPIACTLVPLFLFFIFYWRRLEYAQLIALRATDLAFTVIFFIVTIDLLIAGYFYLFPTTQQDPHQVDILLTFALLIYMAVALVIGTVQAFRGKAIKYILSLRIAERVFNAVSKKQRPS